MADNNDSLSCSVCFENFNDGSRKPKILSCGHSLCEECIDQMIWDKSVTCPNCRRSTDVNQINTNYSLLSVISMLNTKRCEEHGERLVLFCKSDNALICVLCRDYGKHKGHEVNLAEEESSKLKLKLRSVIKNSKIHVQKLKKQRDELNNQINTLTSFISQGENYSELKEHTILSKSNDVITVLQKLDDLVDSESKFEANLPEVSTALLEKSEGKKLYKDSMSSETEAIREARQKLDVAQKELESEEEKFEKQIAELTEQSQHGGVKGLRAKNQLMSIMQAKDNMIDMKKKRVKLCTLEMSMLERLHKRRQRKHEKSRPEPSEEIDPSNQQIKNAMAEVVQAQQELERQERLYKERIEALELKAESGGIFARARAKNELAQLLGEDPLPLTRAKITHEAATRKLEKAKQAGRGGLFDDEPKSRPEGFDPSNKQIQDATAEVARTQKELERQERLYKDAIEAFKLKAESGGLVSRNRAKNLLEQLLSADPLPLRRAKVRNQAAVKQLQKAKQASVAIFDDDPKSTPKKSKKPKKKKVNSLFGDSDDDSFGLFD